MILYEDNEALVRGLSRRQISGTTDIPTSKLAETSRLANMDLTQNYLPQYTVVNINYKNEILANKEIRRAFSAAINRKEIVDNALSGLAKEISVPILPGRSGYDPKAKGIAYDPTVANDALEKAGWLKGEDGIRRKDGKILRFRFVYIDDVENSQVAEVLRQQFADIGVALDLTPSNINLINADYIRPRNYDMIMMGQNVGIDEDLYSFWHSSQVADPGLNLSGFSDKKVDKLLEQVRKSSDATYRSNRFKQVQEVLIEEQPAFFLYTPIHISALGKEIHGAKQVKVSSSGDLLNNIYDWYIKTKKTR